MPHTYRKKLIEVALSQEAINTASAQEKFVCCRNMRIKFRT
jgi:hypothetical protein